MPRGPVENQITTLSLVKITITFSPCMYNKSLVIFHTNFILLIRKILKKAPNFQPARMVLPLNFKIKKFILENSSLQKVSISLFLQPVIWVELPELLLKTVKNYKTRFIFHFILCLIKINMLISPTPRFISNQNSSTINLQQLKKKFIKEKNKSRIFQNTKYFPHFLYFILYVIILKNSSRIFAQARKRCLSFRMI